MHQVQLRSSSTWTCCPKPCACSQGTAAAKSQGPAGKFPEQLTKCGGSAQLVYGSAFDAACGKLAVLKKLMPATPSLHSPLIPPQFGLPGSAARCKPLVARAAADIAIELAFKEPAQNMNMQHAQFDLQSSVRQEPTRHDGSQHLLTQAAR